MAKMGRPTKYSPGLCDKVVELAKRTDDEIISKTHLCIELGITKDTLYRWIKKYPDFSDAISQAMHYIELRYQRLGLGLANGTKTGNATSYIWLTKNILNYTDKVENTNRTTITGVEFDDPSDDED